MTEEHKPIVVVAHIDHDRSLTSRIIEILGHEAIIIDAEEATRMREVEVLSTEQAFLERYGSYEAVAANLVKSMSYEEMLPERVREPRVKDWEQRNRQRPRRKKR